MKKLVVLIVFVMAASGFGCSGSEGGGDAGVDGGVDAGKDGGLPPQDMSEPLGPGQVRAGVTVKEADMIGGQVTHGRIGDIKLYNSKIRVIVEGVRRSDGWGSFGGTVADADVVRPAGTPGQSLFGEYFFGFGCRVQDPSSVTIVNDGRDGNPAVVRFEGPDADMPFIAASALKDILVSTVLNTTITVDYVLPPDSEVMEIRVSFPWTQLKIRELDMILQVFMMGDGLEIYKQGPGFDAEGQVGDTEIFIAAGKDVSYGIFGDSETIKKLIKYEGINFYASPKMDVKRGDLLSFTRRFVVTGGGVDPVLRWFDASRKTAGLGGVTGRVTEADGTPAPGARVHVIGDTVDNQGHWDQTIADADGRYSLNVVAGAYRLVPFVDGSPTPAGYPVTVQAGGKAAQDLALPAPAYLQFSSKAADNSALPSKVYMARAGGADRPPASFGEMSWGGYQWVVNAAKGQGKVRLPSGDYTITFGRGFEYTVVSNNLTLVAGQQASAEAVLEKVMDTTGFLNSDFHIHSKDSPDSDVYHEDLIE
ncbi:MAG: carboxypeptidase-like regulatory domain-containing protein [Myxococcota bacterium]|jgi:hypothetical protein